MTGVHRNKIPGGHSVVKNTGGAGLIVWGLGFWLGKIFWGSSNNNNKKRSHTQLDSRKQVIAFQDKVITINIKEAQRPLK